MKCRKLLSFGGFCIGVTFESCHPDFLGKPQTHGFYSKNHVFAAFFAQKVNLRFPLIKSKFKIFCPKFCPNLRENIAAHPLRSVPLCPFLPVHHGVPVHGLHHVVRLPSLSEPNLVHLELIAKALNVPMSSLYDSEYK